MTPLDYKILPRTEIVEGDDEIETREVFDVFDTDTEEVVDTFERRGAAELFIESERNLWRHEGSFETPDDPLWEPDR